MTRYKIMHGDSEDLILDVVNEARYEYGTPFIISDPPFGLPGEDFDQVFRVLKLLDTMKIPQIIILDWRNSHVMNDLRKVGEMIWENGWISGGRSKSKFGILPTHNTIHFIGDRTNFKFTSGSIIKRQPGFSSPRQCSFSKKSGHPYEKPILLMEYLMKGCIDLKCVIDPFCGSGSTIVGAKNIDIPAVGIEKEEKWVKVSQRRIDCEPV